MGGVLQHDIQQIRRQASGDDTALKALLDQQRDTAGVVDMGVSHQHIVDLARVEGQAGVIDLVPALLQAAVNEDVLAAHLQTMAAAGDTLICSVKLSFMALFLSCPFLRAEARFCVSSDGSFYLALFCLCFIRFTAAHEVLSHRPDAVSGGS